MLGKQIADSRRFVATALIAPNGSTPLRLLNHCSERFGCRVYGKLELFSPTGSHKDRESEAIVRYALSRRIRELAIASTGNAAISLAAYSYIHGLECHVFLPRAIAEERLAQIRAYHPIIRVAKGSYAEAIRECQIQSRKKGYLNCNPGARAQKITGDSLIGAEIAERLRPDYTVCATNNGTLLAGVWMGAKKKGLRCRMVAAVSTKSKLAEAIFGFHRIEEPALSESLMESDGLVVDVSHDEITSAAQLLVKDGLIVEGAAAAAVASISRLRRTRSTRVCCVVSGSGLKFPNAVRQLLRPRTR